MAAMKCTECGQPFNLTLAVAMDLSCKGKSVHACSTCRDLCVGRVVWGRVGEPFRVYATVDGGAICLPVSEESEIRYSRGGSVPVGAVIP